MKIELKSLASVGAILAALTATPALAQGIGEWDANGDATIDQEEFNTGLGETGAFGEMDEDASGSVSEEEYTAGVTAAFDQDESGDLNEEEQVALQEENQGWFE